MSRKSPSDSLMNVARPGASVASTSLEKNPIIQSTKVAVRKLGINTSLMSGSSGRIYRGFTPGMKRKLLLEEFPVCAAELSNTVQLQAAIHFALQVDDVGDCKASLRIRQQWKTNHCVLMCCKMENWLVPVSLCVRLML